MNEHLLLASQLSLYAQHLSHCAILGPEPDGCTCGLDALRAELAEELRHHKGQREGGPR
jgi:hypothetical protein